MTQKLYGNHENSIAIFFSHLLMNEENDKQELQW